MFGAVVFCAKSAARLGATIGNVVEPAALNVDEVLCVVVAGPLERLPVDLVDRPLEIGQRLDSKRSCVA